MKVVALVLVVELSPKSQNRLVMVPLELSVKLTVSGLSTLVGLPLKLAAGATAPVPVSALVLPPLLLLTTTTLLKLAALPGAKRTTRLVEPKPERLKGVPETMLKGPPLMVARPLLSDAPPWLVSTKLAWMLEPTATVPKFRPAGETPSGAGVRPLPVTVLAELPPLLVKTTTLLKLPALAGLKATCTWPVWPDVRLKALPLRMAKGKVVETLPVRVWPPPLTSWKLRVLVWPTTTGPKVKLVGLSDNTAADGVTVVTTEAELLAKVGSAAAEVTLAVLVIVPAVLGLTVMATVAVALLTRLPKLHVTIPFD